MKVVLIDEAPGLGIAGDVREVKDGYARNFLIPKGLAVLATPQELARADARKKVEIERRTKLNLEMESVGEKLTEERLLIAVRVGPGGRLYGSVTATEIAEAVNETMGVEIDRRSVQLAQPIRELGHHQTPVRLAPDVIPNVTITVYQEGTEPPPLVEETPEEDQEGVEIAEASGDEVTAETATEEPEATEESSEAAESEDEEAETTAPEEDETEATDEDDDKE